MGWHLDGMNWEIYLKLSWADRWLFHDELNELIDASNGDGDEGGAGRPKEWRK